MTTTWRLVAAGAISGIVAAAALGLLGASGAHGLAALLALSSAGTIVAALVTSIQLLVDEFRHRPVSLRRLWTAIGLFFAGFVLLLLAGGAAGDPSPGGGA